MDVIFDGLLDTWHHALRLGAHATYKIDHCISFVERLGTIAEKKAKITK